jgi:putative hydrolase of the HAD superfamily
VRDLRAVVFDLDDTLYPKRHFVLSGFRAVAAYVEREHGLPRAAALEALQEALDHGDEGRELQYMCERFALPMSLVRSLVDVVRGHEPSLELPRQSVRALRLLRSSWRLGILTNGVPAIQKRKVEALGVGGLVDTVVFATEWVSGRGKPEAAGFVTALARLDVAPEAAVFVGDNPETDIAGAAKLGMKTIYVESAARLVQDDAPVADALVTGLGQVPFVVERLVPRKARAHVA